MRTPACVLLMLLATSVFAGPKKKPAAKPAGGRAAVVVDAPPAMARLLQSTLGARYSASINTNAISDSPTAKEVRSLTVPAKAIAVVLARSAGDSWSITVLNGADGTPLENQVFRAAARKPLKALPKDVAAALVLACATGQAPPTEAAPPAEPTRTEPKVTETKTEPAKKPEVAAVKSEPATKEVVATTPSEPKVSTSTSAPSTPSPLPALRVGLGFRGFGRSLTWAGDPEQALAKYGLKFASAVAIDATWYPGAHVTSGVLANLGVAFTGDIAVGLSSAQDTSKFGTRADRYRLSAAFRQPFGSIFSIEAVAGASVQRFSIDPLAANDGTPRPNIPSVAFTGPRGALGVRLVKLGPIGIDAMGGFTFLVSTGELGTDVYFKRARGFGVDAGAGVSVELVENLHLRASFDWTRYFLTLNPEEGARFTSPSASDQYLGGSVALQWVM